MAIFEELKQKDSTVSLNSDRIGQSLQAIVFTKNGKIVITNSIDSIYIEQDGRDMMKFNISQKEEAVKKLKEIIELY